MKEFTPPPDSASIVSVTDRVKPVALGMAVTSAHFLGDRAAFVGGEENVALVDAKGEVAKVAVHSGGILSTAFDGKRLVMGGDDGKVVSLERYRTLALAAHERLAGSGYEQSVELRHADGLQPDRTLGQFDRILVNGVTHAIPEALLNRLAPSGRIVAALRVQGLARRVVVTRLEDGGFDHALGPVVRLAPLAPGLARAL